MTFADAPAKAPAAGNRQGGAPAAKVQKRNKGFFASPSGPAKPASGRGSTPNDSSVSGTAATEFERYEGKLKSQDVSFALHLFHNGIASAEYSPVVGTTIKYAGDYKGQDGNYLVNLTRTGAGTDPAKALTLTLRGLGGMETGTFTVDTSSTHREIAEFKLVSADTGATGKTGKYNRARQNRSMQRRNRPGGQKPPGLRSSLQNRFLYRKLHRYAQIL